MEKRFDKTDIFFKKGITGECVNLFSKNNIIVGENGSGKTRFLEGVKEYYIEHLKYDSENIVYAYFPDLTANGNGERYVMPESLFQSFLGKRPHTFNNFIRCIESDSEKFIRSLLDPVNLEYTETSKKCEKAKEKLNEKLSMLAGYQIEIKDSVVYLCRKSREKNDITTTISRMSPGERVLFYLSLYIIILQEIWGAQDKLFIILDEPELHLHTKALLDFIKVLKEQVKYTELWIATHSYALTSQFEFAELTCIKNGELQKRNSKLYKEIYKNLIGMGDERLYDFFVNIDKWEYYEFIAKCFAYPETVARVDSNDVQFRQFLDVITQDKKRNEIKVLDFGAGEERIKQCFNMYMKENDLQEQKVEFYGYDISWEDDKVDKFHFNNLQKLSKSGIKFDYIVMMNVLHEIDIKDWYKTFGALTKILNEKGTLLLVEVETLTNGEQPYGDSGFLIMYENQLKIMFSSNGIKQVDLGESVKKSNAFLLKKKQIMNISNINIMGAIESLKDDTYKELSVLNEIRKKIAKAGISQQEEQRIRRYAFLSQLYLNALFAYESLIQ